MIVPFISMTFFITGEIHKVKKEPQINEAPLKNILQT